MQDRPQRASRTWTVLSSGLAAAVLNLATSLLDRPRALGSALALGLPLVASLPSMILLAAGGLAAARAASRPSGGRRAPLEAAWLVAFLLGAALHPLVEAGLREATAPRASVVLLCAVGFLVSAGACAYVHVSRRGDAWRPERWLSALALLAFVCLAVLWFHTYHVEGGMGRSVLALGGCLAGVAALRLTRGLAPGALLASLGGSVLLLGVVGATTLRRSHADPEPPTSDRPPVVLITVDTLRADRVLGEGPTRVPTPAIRRPAADSVVFREARSAAPWTKPSLATLLTGLSPLVHGMTSRRARLPEEVDTLAERMRAAGYRTAAFGL